MSRARGPHAATLAGAAVILVWHACATAQAFDAGELVGAAFVLGPSHPPGQPLHSLLGYLATLLPLGPAAFRVSLVSVASALAAAWLAGRAASELLAALLHAGEVGAREARFARYVPDAVAVALLLCPPLLRQTTRPEVYASALSLYALALLALLRWARGDVRGLLVGALAAGLASALHPPHALAAVLVGLGVLLIARRDAFRRRRGLALGFAALAFLIGASVHALMPVRTAAGAPSWGDATTWSGFVTYVSAQAYQKNLGAGQAGILDQTFDLARYIPLAAGLVPLVGLLILARRASSLPSAARSATTAALAATPLAAIAAFVRPIDETVPDAVAYAGPAVLTLIVVGGAGLGALLAPHGDPDAADPSSRASRRQAVALGLLVVAAANVTSLPRALEALAADAPALDALATSFVATPPTRALVVLTMDFPAGGFVMERDVADARPDLAVMVSGLASSSFTWRDLARHPVFQRGPVRGPGRDAWERFTNGALGIASGQVPIAVEDGRWLASRGALDGPYLIAGTASSPRVASGIGERLEREVARLAPRDAGGDHDVTGAILRQHVMARADRLAARESTDAALGELADALWFLPREQRGLVERAAASSNARPEPTQRVTVVVRDRDVYLASRGDLVRATAALLHQSGAFEPADALLRAAVARGDARAELQRAWLAGGSGETERAVALAHSALGRDPLLAPDVEALLREISP